MTETEHFEFTVAADGTTVIPDLKAGPIPKITGTLSDPTARRPRKWLSASAESGLTLSRFSLTKADDLKFSRLTFRQIPKQEDESSTVGSLRLIPIVLSEQSKMSGLIDQRKLS